MSERVIIGLEPDTDWKQLRRELSSLGAESVTEPGSLQPDVVVATVEAPKVEEFIAQAGKVRGVRYAERDAWRFST